MRGVRGPVWPLGLALVLPALWVWAPSAEGEGTKAPSLSSAASGDALRVTAGEEGRTAGGSDCNIDAECNDGLSCTADLCIDKACLNVPIQGCVPCDPVYNCAPVELVFIMDTSGSMRDEADALCSGMQDLVMQLWDQGLQVTPFFYGITTVGEGFACLTNSVVSLFGGVVTIDPSACPFPTEPSSFESWGPAIEIAAERFPWTPGARRIIVPLSDEGPCEGSRPACSDPGPDRASIDNAIEMCVFMDVTVSPILGTGADECTISLGQRIAGATGGQAFQTKLPLADLISAVKAIITADCEVDDSCDDGHVCTAGDHCVEGVCIGQPISGCRSCKTSSGCNDSNECTNDLCQNGTCRNNPNYDQELYCCNPLNHTLTPLDDGDPCTEDVCDADTGRVSHPPALAGVPCNDGVECSVRDVCNGAGSCAGADISTIRCIMHEQCYGFDCNFETGYCVCGDVPTLCLEVEPDPQLQGDCHRQNSLIKMNVQLGSSIHTITGGQFRIKYDPQTVQFFDAEPGFFSDPTSPFLVELMRLVDELEGTVFYAVGAGLGSGGTSGPARMAQLRFIPITTCASDAPCYLDQNPQRTVLTDNRGRTVAFEPCCNTELRIHGAAPQLSCPRSVVTPSDPGSVSAMITWDPPRATSECGSSVQLSCGAQNSYGVPIQHLINGGGQVPAGLSQFNCEAVDSCGARSTCSWSVVVEESNLVELDVQLSPTMSSGPIQRCIEFAFYSTCSEPPAIVEETLTFGFPFNLPGRADNFVIQVPPGQYVCVTARDPKHTLRSTANLQIVGNKYVASFLGDPMMGGNWLVNGNLDGNGVIDGVDQAIMLSGFTTSVNPNSPCGTVGFHPDINGDGSANSTDLLFIQRDFLKTNMPVCCPNVTASVDNTTPTLSITLEEARAMGLGDLSAMDLNRDGKLSLEDGAAILRRDFSRAKRTSDRK